MGSIGGGLVNFPLYPSALSFAVEDPKPNEPAPALSHAQETSLAHDTDRAPALEPDEETRQTPAAPYATFAQVAELLADLKAAREQSAKDIKAVHALTANNALRLDALDHKVDHAIDVARGAQSAAVMASDSSAACLAMLNEKVMQALYDIDLKLDASSTRAKGEIDAVGQRVSDLAVVVSDHLEVSTELRDRAWELEKATAGEENEDRLTLVENRAE